MPRFEYRAASASGETVVGQIDASSEDVALRSLRSQGMTPIEISGADGLAGARAGAGTSAAGKTKSGWWQRFRAARAPDHRDVYVFTTEMAVMLRAGLQLDRALRIQRGMSANAVFARLLDDVLRSIKRGESLSEALAPHVRLFGEFYVNMVRSGEVGGRLAEVMQRLSEHLERVKALRESAVSALIYPSILLAVAVLSLVLLLGFVVPQFEALFVEMGEALPAPTRIVVGAGHAVAEWGWLIALVMLLVGLGARKWLSTPAGRSWWDRRLLALPVIGAVMRKFEISRFARSMGTLLAGGVPIVVAIRIAADTVASRSLRAAINEVVPQIKQGSRVADALERLGEFSPLALNMVRVGEETGQLDGMLLELARVYDAEVQSGIKRALTLVEPLVILLLGGIIAAIIVSILMGILAVNDLVV